METSDTLQQAIESAREGDHAVAARLLARYVTQDPGNDTAWVWLAACLDEPEKKRYCLKKANEINPNNPNTIEALARFVTQQKQAQVQAQKQKPPFEPGSIKLPAPEIPVVPQAEPPKPVTPTRQEPLLTSLEPIEKPVRRGLSRGQMTILIILVLLIVVVLAVLAYFVFFADPAFLPTLLQSLTGG